MYPIKFFDFLDKLGLLNCFTCLFSGSLVCVIVLFRYCQPFNSAR